MACIRQISQKEADFICEIMVATQSSIATNNTSSSTNAPPPPAFIGSLPGEGEGERRVSGLTNLPLEAVLFSLLDVETDPRLRRDIEECISSLLLARGVNHLPGWMRTLKQLLQVCTFLMVSSRPRLA